MPNRLAQETSPYLLQHADNPVDWYPWGDDAFERARAEDKPILLSVGYAACHWCHVMEHESFEDEETARLMNERFVPVKVDREERPGRGRALHGGRRHHDRPRRLADDRLPRRLTGGRSTAARTSRRSRASTCRASRSSFEPCRQAYEERRGELEEQADALVGAIREASERPPSNEPLTSELVVNAVSALRAQFDPEHGGFGRAPKFPPASNLELLLRTGRDDALAMVRTTLDGMAAGGMYDVLGGGFHRYSVDEAWLVPHFEKMLYDNALLAPTVPPRLARHRGGAVPAGGGGDARLHGPRPQASGRRLRLGAGRGHRRRRGPHLLVDRARRSRRRSASRIRSGSSPSSTAAPSSAARCRRMPAAGCSRCGRSGRSPFRDDKAITAWNGMALAAFAEAAHRLERPDYLEVALDLARFLGETMADGEGGLLRTYRDGVAKIDGYLEDYAHVANGYVELHWATGDPRWLEEAYRLAQRAQAFADPERGGWFVGDHDLVARRKEFDDHPTPSGNSMMAFVALRLARIWGDEVLERAAVGAFRLARPLLERAPTALGHMLCALDLHFSTPREVAVVGESEELRSAALQGFQPNTVFAFAPEPTDAVPLLAGRGLVDGSPAAYVCERFACQAPVTSREELLNATG